MQWWEPLIGVATIAIAMWLWHDSDKRKEKSALERAAKMREEAAKLPPGFIPLCICLSVDESMLGSMCWVCGGWIPGRNDAYAPITQAEYEGRGSPGGSFSKWVLGPFVGKR